MRKVTVTIDDNGSSTIKVEGVKGVSCKSLTAGLERALGGKVVTSEPTKEMKEREDERQYVNNR